MSTRLTGQEPKLAAGTRAPGASLRRPDPPLPDEAIALLDALAKVRDWGEEIGVINENIVVFLDLVLE